MLFFEYETSFTAPRIEPALYIEATVVRVYAYDDHDDRFLVCVLLADNVRTDCAANDGVPLYQVFDSDGWEFLWADLFDDDDEPLEELGFESGIHQVVIVYRMFFCVRLKPHAVAVFQGLQDFY